MEINEKNNSGKLFENAYKFNPSLGKELSKSKEDNKMFAWSQHLRIDHLFGKYA